MGKKLEVVQLVKHYKCKGCDKILIKRALSDVASMKPGPKRSKVNIMVTVTMYTSAITMTKMHEFCAEAGLIALHHRTLYEMQQSEKKSC